jgi:AI-2 transport protein TqsA
MVHERRDQNWLITVSLAILAVVALATALIYTRAVMIPFVVALFVVALVSPVEDFLVKRLRLPRIIAIVVTLLVVLAVISLVFLLVAQAVQTIVSTAGEYSASFAYVANKVLAPIESLYREETPEPPAAPNDAEPPPPMSPNDTVLQLSPAPKEAVPVPSKPMPLQLYPVVKDDGRAAVLEVRPDLDAAVKDFNEPAALDKEEDLSEQQGPRLPTKEIVRDLKNYIFSILTNAFGTVFGLISGGFFVIIFVLFFLLGRNPYAEHSEVYTDIVQKIRRYVGIKVAISTMTGLLVWASLSIIGLELAGVFGILAFLLNFIPSIGSIVATLLPIPIAVVQFQSPLPIILAVAVPGVIQNLLGNVIEPKLMGEGLNLHPVTILLALSFWGLLWGIVGMFLAAPITAAIRIVLMQFDMFRPIANLLAGDFSSPPKNGSDTT